MARRKPRVITAPKKEKGGFTMIEVGFSALVLLLLILVPVSEAQRRAAKSSVEDCQRMQERIAKVIWGEYSEAGEFPLDAADVLRRLPGGNLNGGYEYTVIGQKRSSYYLRCRHDHSASGVLYVDSGADFKPRLVYTDASARGTMP